MAEGVAHSPVESPLARGWRRISPRLVPLMAVITAFIIGVPFMIFTRAKGNVAEGLYISGAAYSALIEGSLGLVRGDLVSRDNADLVFALAAQQDLTARELNSLGRSAANLAEVGSEKVRRYAEILGKYPLSDEEFDALGESLTEIAAVGADTLAAMRPLIADLSQLERRDVRTLAEPYRAKDTLSANERAEIEAAALSAANLSDEDLLKQMAVVHEQGIATLERLAEQVDVLAGMGLDANSADAATIVEMAAGSTEDARALAETLNRLDAAGITDPATAADQMTMVRRMFDADLFSQDSSVHDALENEFEGVIAENMVVRRPGNRLLVAYDTTATAGIIWQDSANTPENPADDRPETVFLRLGDSALLFIVSSLEATIVRSIPFIIAGLAVALGFKAGLFNIGAEGQLYAGGIVAVFVGYSGIFAGLPALIHLPLVLVSGLL
ncbi:MAG: hypothetical protein K8J31_28755, partial [Anaerolineae bacterium]|nr:hypothetical protein [Anaerolineae bacterium]